MTESDGRKYSGTFKNDAVFGKVAITNPDGTTATGVRKNGKIVINNQDGTQSESLWKQEPSISKSKVDITVLDEDIP